MTTQAPEQDLLSLALGTDDPTALLATAEALLGDSGDAIALAAQGVARRRQGDEAGAIGSLLKAADEVRDDLGVWRRVADAVDRLGLSDSFLEELRNRADRAGSETRHWVLLGRFQSFLNRPADAVASLIEATTRGASPDIGWLELASTAISARRPDVCLDTLDRLVQLDPKRESYPDVVRLRVGALCQAARPLEALRVWRTHPLPLDEIDTQERAVQLAQALLEHAPPHAAEAVEVIDRIEPSLADRPHDRWVALLVKAQALIVAAKPAEALTLLETADAGATDKQVQVGVRFWQAVALEQSGRVEEALAKADDALAGDPSADDASHIHLVRARLLNRKREFRRALDALTGVAAAQPAGRHPAVALQEGIALAGLGQNELALARLEEARAEGKDSPAFASILYWMGIVLNAVNRPEDALGVLAEAHAAGFLPAERHAIYLAEAAALDRLGRVDAAVEKLDRGVEAAGSATAGVELLLLKARLLESQGKVDLALAVLDSALARTPGLAEQGPIHLQRAITARRAGPGQVSDVLASADAALATLAGGDTTTEARGLALTLRAWALRVRGDWAAALDSLERVVTLQPAAMEDVDFIGIRSDTLLQLGRSKEAVDLIEGILNGCPPLNRHPAIRAYLAEARRRMGGMRDYVSALAGASEVPPEYAGDYRAWMAAANARLAGRQWKEARDAFEELKRLDPKLFESPQVRVIRSMALAGLGEHRAVLALLEDCRELPVTWKALAALFRAQAWIETGDLDHALAALDEGVALAAGATELDPALSVFALVQKASCLVRMERPEAALATLGAIKALPRSADFGEFTDFVTEFARAAVLNRLGRYDEALESIDAAIRTDAAGAGFPPGVEPGRAVWSKGIILLDADREEEALRAFEQARRAGLPGNEALVWQGRTLLALEDPARALRAFEAAVADAAGCGDAAQHADALVGKGRALHNAHTYEAALEAYREALRVGSAAVESDDHYWRQLGETSYALERYAAAVRAFRRGWQIRHGVHLALGISAALIRQKRYAEALRFLDEEARKIAAQDARLTFNRGLALWCLGRKSEAKSVIEGASRAGVTEAAEFVAALKSKSEDAGGWWDTWFGDQAGWTRRVVGSCLLVAVATSFATPAIAYFQNGFDWKATLVPAVAGLALLLIPSIKGLSLSTEGVKLDVEPLALRGDEEVPEARLLPLGPGAYVLAAAVQAISKQPAEIRRPEFEGVVVRGTSSLSFG